VSHKPGSRLPLLSARPAVTLATLKRAATNFVAFGEQRHRHRHTDTQTGRQSQLKATTFKSSRDKFSYTYDQKGFITAADKLIPFLPPNQQHQSTEGTLIRSKYWCIIHHYYTMEQKKNNFLLSASF